MPFELHDVCPLLQVFDMPTSLAFYRDVLGFEVVAAAPPAAQVGADQFDWVHVRRDGADLMLNAVYERDAPRPPTPSSSRVAAHDDTALFISCSDVDEAYEHLRARGITVDPPTDNSTGSGFEPLAAHKSPGGQSVGPGFAISGTHELRRWRRFRERPRRREPGFPQPELTLGRTSPGGRSAAACF